MKKQGQQGSPRGNIEKETAYIVIPVVEYITWEMLFADSNDSVRLHIATYNVVHDGVPGLAKLICGSVSWIYVNQSLKMQQVCLSVDGPWRKASAVSRGNDHRCSIFARVRHSLDNQKWAYFYRRRNGNVNTLIGAQRAALDHRAQFILFHPQHWPCPNTVQAVCRWRCPAAVHRRDDLPARCCLICLSVDYSLFQGCCKRPWCSGKIVCHVPANGDTWDHFHEEEVKEAMFTCSLLF